MPIYALFCAWCASIVAAATQPQAIQWNHLVDQAEAQARAGDYEGALQHYRDALHVAETFGPRDLRLPSSLDYLGNVYSGLGRWQESEAQYRRALAMIEALNGRETVNYAMVLLDLAITYGNSGRLDLAGPTISEALPVLARLLPAKDARTATARATYAVMLSSRKQYAEAEELLRQAIAALQGKTESCSLLASSYENLGLVLGREGRTEESAALYGEGLDTMERCLGPDHPTLVQPLNNLGVTYSMLGRTAEAEAAFRRGISICEQTLGFEHPRYAKILGNYAAFLQQNKRKPEARKMAERARSAAESIRRQNGEGLTIDVTAFRK